MRGEPQPLDRLREALDRQAGRYRELGGALDFGSYLARDRPREDEEMLTEPLLADLLERLLGFPPDAYFPQRGRSGLKPDFTPHDLVAHRFVLDAKSSTQELGDHEPQIRRYIDQRQLDYGVLFNLREVRVYRRGERGHARASRSLCCRWLYGPDNNYDWYRPGDEALVEVLYALLRVPLGKLDADVLGGLYELYVDEIDRDRLGQFFTPRAVVRFMLDRAGFRGPAGVFRLEGDERRPRRVLDFATGSGGFLVEAARRVIDEGGLREDDPRDLTEGLAAIVRGFHGGRDRSLPLLPDGGQPTAPGVAALGPLARGRLRGAALRPRRAARRHPGGAPSPRAEHRGDGGTQPARSR